VLPQADTELRKVAWLAAADGAALRCRGPQRAAALQALQALDRAIDEAQPEGSAIGRQVLGLRSRCG
jgi:eukaryotic-like serine/threonine-protein kinase